MDDDKAKENQVDPLPIAQLSNLSPSQLEVLGARWITTMDAFVGLAATQQGRTGLCDLLEIDDEELDSLLDDARKTLGNHRYQALIEATGGGPLGALFNDNAEDDSEGGPNTEARR